MGRAPTSGYCHTCRKRRVKCDRGKPGCQKCARLGRQCDGYDMPLRMESYVGGGPSNMQTARLVTASAPRAVPVELDLHGFQELMAFTHFFENYHWAHFWRPAMQVDEDPGLPMAKYNASLAVAYGYMANIRNVPDLKVKSLGLYQSAIGFVKGVLASGSLSDIAKIIPLLLSFNQYEYAVDGKDGIAHHLGVQQILKSCGPAYFTQQSELAIFRNARESLLCLSLGRKRRLFLSDNDWKTIPWAHIPKNTYDELLDILLDLPEIVEKAFSQSELISSGVRPELQYSADSILSRLSAWRSRWDGLHPNAARVVPSNLPEENLKGRVFHDMLLTAFEFTEPRLAAEILTYNAAIVKLVQVRCILNDGQLDFYTPVSINRAFSGLEMMPPQAGNSDPGLLLPDQLQVVWQPAIEALRVLACVPKQLSVDKGEIFLSVSSIRILYAFLKRFDMQELVVFIMGGRFDLKGADKEFGYESEIGPAVAQHSIT